MDQTQFKNSYLESLRDIKVSLILFKENWREFILTEIIGMILILLLLFTVNIILFSSRPFILSVNKYPFSRPQIEQREPIIIAIGQFHYLSPIILQFSFFITLVTILVLYTYLATNFGLAYDIFNSGDQFTEFTNSFSYFKKNFFKYSFITFSVVFLSGIVLLLGLLHSNKKFIINHNFFESFSIFLIQLGLFIILSMVFTGVTAGNSILKALKENIHIFITKPIRLLVSWSLFIIIFSIPAYIGFLLFVSVLKLIFGHFFLISGNFFLILNLTGFIFMYPLMSLIATRIYITSI